MSVLPRDAGRPAASEIAPRLPASLTILHRHGRVTGIIAPGMVVARIAARLFALVALAAVAVGVYLIVHSGLSHHAPTPQPSTLSPTVTSAPPHHRSPRFYVVRGGDTLSGISVRTHVAIFQLNQLNPGLSPNSLQTGQRLRLRR